MDSRGFKKVSVSVAKGVDVDSILVAVLADPLGSRGEFLVGADQRNDSDSGLSLSLSMN